MGVTQLGLDLWVSTRFVQAAQESLLEDGF
jgi:hypothetical protein